MTSTEILREKVKQYIDHADDKSLRLVKAMFEKELEEETEEDEDWWDDLPDELKNLIDAAIKEGVEGKTIPHEQIVEKYAKWFRK